KVLEQLKLGFPILSDQGGRLAQLFGVRWRIPELLRDIHRKSGIDLHSSTAIRVGRYRSRPASSSIGTLLQRYGKVVGQYVSPVPREPAQAGLNVRLLEFVELFAGRDVRLRRALSARRCARPPRWDGLTNRCLHAVSLPGSPSLRAHPLQA